MRAIIVLLVFSQLTRVYAGNIYKCTDNQGNVSFSSTPCVEKDSKQEAVSENGKQSEPSTNSNVVGTKNYPTFNIVDQKDFEQFIERLTLRNMSHVLSGVSKGGFHGLSLSQVTNMQHLDYMHEDNETQGLGVYADISPDPRSYFHISYFVWAEGRNSHPFLDLSSKQIVTKMRSLGFGEPIAKGGLDESYLWNWGYGNWKCVFVYKRAIHSPEKGFSYGCDKK